MQFTPEEKSLMVAKVQRYFSTEFDQELGSFDAEFLIDFFAEEMGPFYYNRGLYDAESTVNEKVAEISDRLLDLEMPVSTAQ